MIDADLNSMNNSYEEDSKFKKILRFWGVVLLYFLKYFWRGATYIFKDIPTFLWKKLSRGVDEAVPDGDEFAPKKKNSALNMDLKDLYANSIFMKKKMEALEKEKGLLQADLAGNGAIRSPKMVIYQFTARNPEGKIETSIMGGQSKLDIYTFLSQEGYEVFKIETNKQIEKKYSSKSMFSPKMKTKDLLFWLTQLGTYIKSGITLTESIKILNQQMGKKPLYKRTCQSIVYELTMGESFSSALEKQGTVFPTLLINMIKAAEATGELDATLDDMANYYDEMEKTRKQMISALTYPSIVMIFALAIVTFILVWVIPQFVGMYASANAQIPPITKIVMHLSDFLQVNLLWVVLLIIVAVVIFMVCYNKIKDFRIKVQTFMMKFPVIGNIMIYNEMSIFSKTFSSLLKNNVFITESIDILSKITNNEIYKKIMYNTIENVVNGEKISKAFKDHWAVPDVAYYMIVTGESTGELALMMSKVSDYYQELHRNAIGSLKSLIEPITIVFLALIVGVILLSVIIPMFGIMDTVQM